MSRFVLLAVMLATAACGRGTPAEPAPGAGRASTRPPADTLATTPDAPQGQVALESTGADSHEDLPFDTKAFAGTFEGTLPCADCPATGARLTLSADGSFTLERRYKLGESTQQAGTWTVESGDARLRLDPDSKRDEDRLFQIVSHGELRALDGSGMPIASDADARMTRLGD